MNREVASKITAQLKYVIEKSVFYQNKFKNQINDESEINEDIFKFLPFTTKSELLEDQAEYLPFGSNLCVSSSEISRVHKTSGTSNKPLLIALTKKDIENTIKVGAECFKLSGLSESDIVIHCLNYNMWAGGYTDHQSLETAGAAVIPFGVGHTKELIETILSIRPTAIHCTPSYLRKIEAVLKENFGLVPIDLNLKLGLFGGESGLQNPDFRKEIETKWGIKAMNANYGMSDVLSIFGSECSAQNGLHFMAQDVLYPELINPSNGELLELKKGVSGELVLTNLHKEAQPLVRYRTNDLIKILSVENCACGENGFRFEVIGRSDDMFVFKGINVFLSAIEKIINKQLTVLTGQYQVHVNKAEPIDEMKIIIEKRNISEQEKVNIFNCLSVDFSEKLLINPEIVFVDEGTLPLTEGKTKKIFKTL